ncbi:MAG: hypothetical protein H6492_00850 [Candidatus Paracaedibacteraceae bacterium]|nr:hypothetical protein [Candidatus Paracaedibacteraceae bacterium]
MKQAFNLKHRSKKAKIVLPKVTLRKDNFPTASSNNISRKCSFSALRYLWEQQYINFDDYLIACKYAELSNVVGKLKGGPQGFSRKVSWHNFLDTSKVSWIQSELSVLDQEGFQDCIDDKLLIFWKSLQSALYKVSPKLKEKFDQVLFLDGGDYFFPHIKLYIKAFQKVIPVIKLFMIEFFKQKNPQ